jgi:hypothetical protein
MSSTFSSSSSRREIRFSAGERPLRRRHRVGASSVPDCRGQVNRMRGDLGRVYDFPCDPEVEQLRARGRSEPCRSPGSARRDAPAGRGSPGWSRFRRRERPCGHWSRRRAGPPRASARHRRRPRTAGRCWKSARPSAMDLPGGANTNYGQVEMKLLGLAKLATENARIRSCSGSPSLIRRTHPSSAA